MVSNDDFDGKATHLNCFYLHINFEQIYPKPAIVAPRDLYILTLCTGHIEITTLMEP